MKLSQWMLEQFVSIISDNYVASNKPSTGWLSFSRYTTWQLTVDKVDSAETFVAKLNKLKDEMSELDYKTSAQKVTAVVEEEEKSISKLRGVANKDRGTYDGLLWTCKMIFLEMQKISDLVDDVHQKKELEDEFAESPRDAFCSFLAHEYFGLSLDFLRDKASSSFNAKYARQTGDTTSEQLIKNIKDNLKFLQDPWFSKSPKHVLILMKSSRDSYEEVYKKYGQNVPSFLKGLNLGITVLEKKEALKENVIISNKSDCVDKNISKEKKKKRCGAHL